MAVIVEDHFVEGGAVDVKLDSHVPDTTGTGWTEEEKTGVRGLEVDPADDNLQADSSESSDRAVYSSQPNPTATNYYLELEFITGEPTSADDPAGLFAYWDDASNWYSGGTYESDAAADKKIYEEVSGVITELATGDSGITANDVLKFEVNANSQKLYKNGGLELSATDGDLSGPGKCGVFYGNLWVATNDIQRWQWDNYVVTEVGAAPTTDLATKYVRLDHLREPMMISGG
jgi:hypothetical protein